MIFSDKITAVKKIPLLALLCVIIFAVLSPALKNGFVDWDDVQYVISNPALRGSWMDTLTFFPGYYHPLTILTYKIEFVLFGLNPAPYHLTNLALHLINCVSAFYLFILLGAGKQSAFLGALLFGIHPVHVEPVAWIAGRKELLWGLFLFWTLVCYLRFINTGLKRFLICSLSFFVLAVFSKPFALVIPFMILLADYYRKRVFDRALLLEKAPYFILALPLFLLSYAPSGFLLRSGPVTFNFFTSVASVCQSALFYARKLIAPFGLSALYPSLELPVNSVKYIFLPSLVVLSLAGLAWYARRSTLSGRLWAGTPAGKGPDKAESPGSGGKTVFGLGFFMATIFPALIVSPPADRYNYVPAAGLCFLYGEFIVWLYGVVGESRVPMAGEKPGQGRFERPLLFRLIFTALVSGHFFVLGLASVYRTSAWKDSMTLWSDVLKKYPLEYVAYYGRGNAYNAAGQFRNALTDFTRCLELHPGYWKALGNRGRTFAEMKEYDKAIADYGAGIAINPAEAQLFLNRGNAYFLKEKYDRAVKDYDRALVISPYFAQAAENKRIAVGKLAQPLKSGKPRPFGAK